MKALIIGFLLAWSPAAHAEEPEFTILEAGQAAPFKGRLLNDAAVKMLIVDNKLKVEQCNIQIEYEVGKAKIAEQYKYDLLSARSEADDQRLQDMIAIRDDRIENLEKYVKPDNKHWWLTGGVVIGAASAIGIMYAIAPGLR